jgi:hypothetical protein
MWIRIRNAEDLPTYMYYPLYFIRWRFPFDSQTMSSCLCLWCAMCPFPSTKSRWEEFNVLCPGPDPDWDSDRRLYFPHSKFQHESSWDSPILPSFHLTFPAKAFSPIFIKNWYSMFWLETRNYVVYAGVNSHLFPNPGLWFVIPDFTQSLAWSYSWSSIFTNLLGKNHAIQQFKQT